MLFYLVHDNVLWLDIAMDDLLAVDSIDSQAHLPNDIGCEGLWEPSLFF